MLRLFQNSGRFEEVVDVAVEYMQAALGVGKEYYGFRYSVLPTSPAFCLPIRNIDLLIRQLKAINEQNADKPLINVSRI